MKWFSGRRLLVSQYHSSIMSNLIAMALTLAGPRIWILLKAFVSWLHDLLASQKAVGACRHIRLMMPWKAYSIITRSRTTRGSECGHRRSWFKNNVLPVAEESHSELGAARDLIALAMDELRTDRIELPDDSNSNTWDARGIRNHRLNKPWRKFLERPLDIILPLLLSVVLIGVFVAESTGAILSANIVGDSTAMSYSSRCFAPPDGRDTRGRAKAYIQQCYHAPQGTEGCNFFYNQSVRYEESFSDICPFRGFQCTSKPKSAISFDTGHIDANYVGINSPKRLSFRRRAVCSPIIPRNGTGPADGSAANFNARGQDYYHRLNGPGFSIS